MNTKDNWEHRSANMRCASCMWFVAKKSALNDIETPLGRCRRHAPNANGFVPVFKEDWCGDHRLDENKLGETPEQLLFKCGEQGEETSNWPPLHEESLLEKEARRILSAATQKEIELHVHIGSGEADQTTPVGRR